MRKLYLGRQDRYQSDMEEYQILVVEDDGDLAHALADHIGDGGYRAVTVQTLAAARNALETEPGRFDLLLLDLGLPDGDGRTFCADLRRSGETMPVIILSGHVDEEDVAQALDDGADAYMRKPLHAPELLARLRRLLPHTA